MGLPKKFPTKSKLNGSNDTNRLFLSSLGIAKHDSVRNFVRFILTMFSTMQSRQTRIDDFLSRKNKMALLRQELVPNQSSNEMCFDITQHLVREVYDAVKDSKHVTGRSARSIALDLSLEYCDDAKDGDFTLESAVQACLMALRLDGYVYPTFDERHFLASVSNFVIMPCDLILISSKVPALLREISVIISSQSTSSGGASQNEGDESALIKCKRRNSGRWVQERECGGKASFNSLEHYIRNAVQTTRNACIYANHPGQSITHSGRGGYISSAEFSPTCEYLLYGCAHGIITVSKCTGMHNRMQDNWQSQLIAPLPVRQINTKKCVETVHWTPETRNEIGVSSKASGDVTIYDLKSSGALSSLNHSPALVLTHRQGQGVGGIMDFACVYNAKLVIAGTQSGAVVIWDRRDNKKPKGSLKQSNGSVCFVQVEHFLSVSFQFFTSFLSPSLSPQDFISYFLPFRLFQLSQDDQTLIGGTSSGVLHIWDLRKTIANVAGMALGGKDNPVSCIQRRCAPEIPNSDRHLKCT